MDEEQTGTINETVVSVFEGKHPCKTIPACARLETYKETHIFIPADITEGAVELVGCKISGSSGLGGTDSEALQVWLIKLGEDITRLRTSMKNILNWLANRRLPWAAYRSFMSGRLIVLEKQPGVCPFVVG